MSDTRTTEKVDVRPYVAADRAEVVDLLRTAMGEGPTGRRTSEFFDWKHIHNPFGPSFMLVAEAGGRIVGLRAFMRWSFEVHGTSTRAVRAVDTATHPDYRRMGIFSKLTARALEDLEAEADLVFNTPNEKSLPGYLKLGWEVVGKLPLYIRPLKLLSFATGLRTRDRDLPDVAPPSVSAGSAASLLEETQSVERLLDQSVDNLRLQTCRSVAFLRWRYADAPFDYRMVARKNREGLLGFAIFRVRPRGRLWEATVAELVVDPHAGDGVQRQLLGDVARAAPVDHLSLAAPRDEALSMARSKFLPSPASITLVTRKLQPSLPTDVTVPRNWALSLGDVEVF